MHTCTSCERMNLINSESVPSKAFKLLLVMPYSQDLEISCQQQLVITDPHQEYIIGRESILLHYGTVLQPFMGVTILVMIFTNKVVSQFVLLHHIAAVATVLVLYRPHSLSTCPQIASSEASSL